MGRNRRHFYMRYPPAPLPELRLMLGGTVVENKLHNRPVCIYCTQEIALGVPRVWLGQGHYAHRDCSEATEEPEPQQDARRRP